MRMTPHKEHLKAKRCKQFDKIVYITFSLLDYICFCFMAFIMLYAYWCVKEIDF